MHVLHGQRKEPFGAAQQQGHLTGAGSDQEAVRRQKERRHRNGLRDVDARRLDLPLRKVDRRHDRRPDAEHQSDARADEEQRRGDVDGGQRVAADAASHENPVRDHENGRENHSQNGGDQQFPKKLRNLHAAEINTVFHRIRFLECKDTRFRPGES